jgi:hypothetical protein
VKVRVRRGGWGEGEGWKRSKGVKVRARRGGRAGSGVRELW